MAILSRVYSIKHPHFIEEEEFFKHLKKVCKDKRIRGNIIDYYQTFIDYDKKNGLTITKDSFGASIFKNPKTNEKEELDILKHIFSEKGQIGMADFFRYQFVNNIKKVRYVNSNTRKLINDLSSGYSINSSGSISSTESLPLGVLTVFNVDNIYQDIKFQIEQFVDSKNIPTRKKLKLAKQMFKEFREKSEKKVVFHECSHLCSIKTACNGRLRQEHPNKYYDIVKQKGYSRGKLSVRGKNELLGYVLAQCFGSGKAILDEICTEITASQNREYITLNDFTKYRFSPKKQMYAYKLDFDENPITLGFRGCLPFNVIIEALKAGECFSRPEEFLLNPDNLDNYFGAGALSPNLKQYACQKLEHLLDKNESFEKTTDYEIFLMTLGKGYKDYISSRKKDRLLEEPSKKDDYSFNEFTQFAQAMIIDVHSNNLKVKIAKAEKFDDYVIKPNESMFLDGQEVFEREFLSNAELAQKHPEVLSLAIWSKQLSLLNEFAKNNQQFSGITKSVLLQKEEDFLKTKSSSQNKNVYTSITKQMHPQLSL